MGMIFGIADKIHIWIQSRNIEEIHERKSFARTQGQKAF